MTNEEMGLALLAEVRDFVAEQNIYCPETIYQMDRVMENASEFIQRLCDIAGYKEDEE